MKVEKFVMQACCGRTQTVYRTDAPVTKEFLEALKSNGFHEAEHFTKAGILYADNSDFIVTGPFGADRLQVKCKKADCDQNLKDFEALLLKLG